MKLCIENSDCAFFHFSEGALDEAPGDRVLCETYDKSWLNGDYADFGLDWSDSYGDYSYAGNRFKLCFFQVSFFVPSKVSIAL